MTGSSRLPRRRSQSGSVSLPPGDRHERVDFRCPEANWAAANRNLLAVTRPARLYISRPILDEYVHVLARPELRIQQGVRQRLLQLIKIRAHVAAPTRRLEVTSDPDDNIFLECVDAAGADYPVTGNQKHFPRFWKRTAIITSREFISLAAPHLIP